MNGVWSSKGYFELIDYTVKNNSNRNVFRFILKLSGNQSISGDIQKVQLSHTRLIPSEVKKEVWKRDQGKCVICKSNQNLHFDHDLPYSRGGTSLTAKKCEVAMYETQP